MEKVMLNKKNIFIAVLLVALIAVSGYQFFFPKNYESVIGVTGATPIALTESVKPGTVLEVSGMTKKVYTFKKDALEALASTYIRTREVAPDGQFQGTYRYSGVPVLHILEGVVPQKQKNAPFDRPLDMIVTFTSADGKTAHFSYGELTMTDDSNPVILAYNRKELTPSKQKKGEVCKANIYHENVKGLRLVCPADPDTARYLDNVVKITLSDPVVPNTGLPVMAKGKGCDIKCAPAAVTCFSGSKKSKMTFAGIKKRFYRTMGSYRSRPRI